MSAFLYGDVRIRAISIPVNSEKRQIFVAGDSHSSFQGLYWPCSLGKDLSSPCCIKALLYPFFKNSNVDHIQTLGDQGILQSEWQLTSLGVASEVFVCAWDSTSRKLEGESHDLMFTCLNSTFPLAEVVQLQRIGSDK